MNAGPGTPANPFSRVWLSGVLLVAFVATGALVLIRVAAPDSDLHREAAAEPDVRMERALLRQFDHDGRLQYALTAPEIRFFQKERRAELTAPDLTLYDDDRTAWQVRAAQGILRGIEADGRGEDEIDLLDDVLLQPLEGLERIRLSTSALTLYPDRQYATTDQAVIIDSEVGRTTAARLEGDLQGGLLKLFNSAERPVQTILLPRQFK